MPLSNTFLLPSPLPSVLYPNLAELENYMGLSLSSQEVQQNLPQILEGTSVGIHLLTDVGTDVSSSSPSSSVLPWKQIWISCFPSIPVDLFLDRTFHCEPSSEVPWDFLVFHGAWG